MAKVGRVGRAKRRPTNGMTLLWGPFIDQLVASEEVDSLTDPGEVDWPVTDHTGTIRDVGRLDNVSGDFLIASHRVYSSFGRLTDEYDPAIGTASDVDLDYGFTARFTDPLTGMTHHQFRWYDPQLGKWISEDPLGFAAGDINTTRYVANAPLSYTDPTGLIAVNIGDGNDDSRHGGDDFWGNLGGNVKNFGVATTAVGSALWHQNAGWIGGRNGDGASVSWEITDWDRMFDLAGNDPITRIELLQILMLRNQTRSTQLYEYWVEFFGGVGDPDVSGQGGWCGNFCDHLQNRIRDLDAGNGPTRIRVVRVEFSSYNTQFGHTALRLEFPPDSSGSIPYGYIDNGWFGGPDGIFFTDDIPSGVANETPGTVGGNPTPHSRRYVPPRRPPRDVTLGGK